MSFALNREVSFDPADYRFYLFTNYYAAAIPFTLIFKASQIVLEVPLNYCFGGYDKLIKSSKLTAI